MALTNLQTAPTEEARRFRKTTIEDVARQAGVSKTTISAFVNGHGRSCSESTARRIEEAIAALHYVPGRGTRGQRDRATRTIGVCVSSPFEATSDDPADFALGLWRGFSEEADEAGYLLLHYPREIRFGSSTGAFLNGSVDGLLLRSHHEPRAALLAEAGLPVVVLNARALPEGCGGASADEDQTVALALSHLWELGHRRIAHLAGPVQAWDTEFSGTVRRAYTALWRLDAFERWTRERRVYDPALIAHGEVWNHNEAQAARALDAWRKLDQPPTAVFCANDGLALNVMRAAQAIGWRVPQQLSVVGVDNRMPGAAATPSLTTVDIPLPEVGRAAVRALLSLMNGHEVEDCRVVVAVSDLIVRHSTAPPA